MRYSAAFGRLSVETIELELIDDYGMAAAFGRLSVETRDLQRLRQHRQTAAFGRLSVETGTGGQVSAA